MSARIETAISVPQDHPSLPGHFPGQPVVPGVVLLDRLIEAAEAALGKAVHVVGMPQVKFLSPLLPGETANAVIEVREAEMQRAGAAHTPGGGTDVAQARASQDAQRPVAANNARAATLHFRVERAGALIAQGTISLASKATAS
jgi:3-hydroxymyristoyl/3-hydroxydecanoyl-(acyl carrier protein) dehydratase